jgi:uroporphyrinogen-III synthase
MSLLKTLSLEFIAGSLAAVIAEMAQIDAIAFTSAPQVRRFRDVARSFGREA